MTIGSVVGGVIGSVAGATAADYSWNAIFGHHNCAAAIYTYEDKNGELDILACSESESIKFARRCIAKGIREVGGQSATEVITFDGWETRCAAYALSENDLPYAALGPSVPRARSSFNELCRADGAKCPPPKTFCNSWRWFAWDHWD